MIYEYIKGITLLSIFIALIEMVLPSQRFSKYIKLVLGFVLMVNIILPFVNFKTYSFELKSIEDLNMVDEYFDYAVYVEAGESISSKAIGEDVKAYVERAIDTKSFEVYSVGVDYEVNGDIVVFTSINIVLGEKNNEPTKKLMGVETIKIDKIEVSGLQDKINQSTFDESTEILDLKTCISKEYNLSIESIYVNIK